MAVAVVPALGIEQIDHVVTDGDGRILVAGQDRRARGDHQAVGRGDDLGEDLRAAEIEAVVIVDIPDLLSLFRVVEHRLVSHLRGADEPALLDRVDELAEEERRTGRPEPHPGVLLQAPMVAIAVGRGALGDGAVDLHLAACDRQVVVARREPDLLAVDFHLDPGDADRVADGIPRFLQIEQLDLDLRAVAQFDLGRTRPGPDRRCVPGATGLALSARPKAVWQRRETRSPEARRSVAWRTPLDYRRRGREGEQSTSICYCACSAGRVQPVAGMSRSCRALGTRMRLKRRAGLESAEIRILRAIRGQ